MKNLQVQIEEIKNRNTALEQGIQKANDSQYIEKVAREELDLQKPGEKTVSFIMPEPQNKESTAGQKNIWQAWLSNVWNWLKAEF